MAASEGHARAGAEGVSTAHECRSCGNLFVQPFVCTTCGAQKLYDATLKSAQDEIERLRALLVDALPHIHGNVAEWRMLLNRPGMSPGAYATANERINSGDALLARIDAAVKS